MAYTYIMFTYSRLMCVAMVIVLLGAIIHKNHMDTIESFMTYGDYPNVKKDMLLYGEYSTPTTPTLSDNNSSDIYKNTPIFLANSVNNNNVRYWDKPTNGKCSSAEFCGAVYDNTPHHIPDGPHPPDVNKSRVNYYESSSSMCG